jgi:hypothetical protein
MRSQQLSLAILVAALAVLAATPVMAGGRHHFWPHRERYVVVEAVPTRTVVTREVVRVAPVTRYRVIERQVIVGHHKHGTATRVIASPQVIYREITPAPTASRAAVNRSVSPVGKAAQDREVADEETQALERLQNKVAEGAKSTQSTRGLADGGAITDNDLEPAGPR